VSFRFSFSRRRSRVRCFIKSNRSRGETSGCFGHKRGKSIPDENTAPGHGCVGEPLELTSGPSP
jgi:hypothetical protein